MSCGKCSRCRGFQYMDRVRDTTGQLGYGNIWAIDPDGTAFVQFGSQGPITVRMSTLELVDRKSKEATQ